MSELNKFIYSIVNVSLFAKSGIRVIRLALCKISSVKAEKCSCKIMLIMVQRRPLQLQTRQAGTTCFIGHSLNDAPILSQFIIYLHHLGFFLYRQQSSIYMNHNMIVNSMCLCSTSATLPASISIMTFFWILWINFKILYDSLMSWKTSDQWQSLMLNFTPFYGFKCSPSMDLFHPITTDSSNPLNISPSSGKMWVPWQKRNRV